MQYWTEMLRIDCEENIKEFWHSICSTIITSRLIQLKVCITIVCMSTMIYVNMLWCGFGIDEIKDQIKHQLCI